MSNFSTGTPGVPSVDTVSVQGVAGGTPIPISSEITLDPTNLATSARQDTAQTSLTAIAASASVMDDWDLTDACKSVAIQKSVTGTTNAANLIAAAGDYADNDIVSHSASDGVGVAWKFTALTRGSGYTATVVGASVATSVEGFAAAVRLHLFNAVPSAATELDDNAAFYIDLDDRAKYLGYVDIAASADFGEFSFGQEASPLAKKITGDSSGDVWAIVQLLDAVTNESAGMSFWPTLHVIQD